MDKKEYKPFHCLTFFHGTSSGKIKKVSVRKLSLGVSAVWKKFLETMEEQCQRNAASTTLLIAPGIILWKNRDEN